MKLSMRFLQASDQETILTFERSLLNQHEDDGGSDMFIEWHASWRQESLEFYLPNGWCFGIFDDDKLVAYFLAQPILFLQGHMQTRWMEHVYGSTADLTQKLLEVAYKTAREKHLQKLLVKRACLTAKDLTSYSYKERDTYFELTTTKMDNP